MSTFVKAAVIGHPIKHSKSPLIHNYWIEKYGLNGSYEAIDLAPDKLAEGIKRLIGEGYSGFNFTVPHKEAALKLCDEVDETATKIGAVNTVYIEDGRIKGTNTDGFGFIENIKAVYPDMDFEGGPAVVLGAGGAARAVVYALEAAGVPEIRVINRTKGKADALFNEMELHGGGVEWEMRESALRSINLLVNTTSLGMEGQPELDLDLEELPADALVNDIVYAPLYTPLLESAKAQGNPVVTGIGMLLHQARPAFEKWFGVLPDVDETLEKKVLA